MRVTDVSVRSSGVRLETSRGPVTAGCVIGADGANSLVRRRLSRPFQRSELSIATGYFAHGVSSREIAIHLVATPPGYIWSFPRPSHLAIGICAQADVGVTSGALRQQTAAWMTTAAIARGARLESYSWPIPSLGPGSFRQLDMSGGRWSLVGDAAGLVDPITREGIYFALLSGAWAADALGADAAADSYARRVREEILTELARAARIKAAFFRPSFINLLIHALDRSAAIRRVMADLIAGRQSYAGLKWRLLQTLEARLAWRAVVGPERW
jgi:flavin-dependent dehydrogenase